MQIDFNARQLLNAQIKGKINISDEEVKKYYEDNKSKFHRPEAYHTRHILAAYFPPEALRNQTVEELKKNKEYFARIAEQKIDKVIEELKNGADFKELAKTQSDDESSRENGGDLDFIYKGIFEASFDEAVAKLKPGEPDLVIPVMPATLEAFLDMSLEIDPDAREFVFTEVLSMVTGKNDDRVFPKAKGS